MGDNRCSRWRIEDIMGHGRLPDGLLLRLLGSSTPLARLDGDLLCCRRSSPDDAERLEFAFERVLRDWLRVEEATP